MKTPRRTHALMRSRVIGPDPPVHEFFKILDNYPAPLPQIWTAFRRFSAKLEE